ncbi:MAG: response regulator transcription factor [Tabrizicola sp.]|nr:response regulator transcription factor [Tabrizicola sp.]
MTSIDIRLNIAVIDENPLLAGGISALLGQDSMFVATPLMLGAQTGPMAPQGFDVIVMDPGQSGQSPDDLARQFGAGGVALLAYSGELSVELARQCISAGFRGVLPKTVSIEVLKAALATAAQGGIYIDAAFSAAIVQHVGQPQPPKPQEDACLSARELFVLKSVAYGKTMKEIGKELDLSSKTVETYKARGSSKLNLCGRRQIVEFAIAQGWVEGARLSTV